MDAHLLDPASSAWSAEIDRLNLRLQAGKNPTLLPNQFLQVVLPKLGGTVVLLREGDEEVGIGFLLPRGVGTSSSNLRKQTNGDLRPRIHRAYTLRYHPLTTPSQPTPNLARTVIDATAARLPDAEVVFYDPNAMHDYQPTHQEIGSVDIGHPSSEEAAQIPLLQQRIWGSGNELLYPADLHSLDFALGSSLVARVDGQLAAFLFGFRKFDGPALPDGWYARFHGDLRLESQTLGVLPDYRGLRIASMLKRVQGEEALAAGIHIVQWTADPLQFPNAALNFGLLRALAFDFYPDLYPFRNALNRVPASRFGLTWLVGSERVQNVPLTGARAIVLDLRQHPEIQCVNQNYTHLELQAIAPHIAIEIPGNWTEMQALDVELALRWREATDRLFSHYVGIGTGQYVISGVATDHEQHFLIAQRLDEALLAHLGHLRQ